MLQIEDDEDIEEVAKDLIISVNLDKNNWVPIQKLGINHIYDTGQTALGIAVTYDMLENVLFLAEHGADVNLYGDHFPPIIDAFYGGLPRIFVCLLFLGANIEENNKAGWILRNEFAINPRMFLNSLFGCRVEEPRPLLDYESLFTKAEELALKTEQLKLSLKEIEKTIGKSPLTPERGSSKGN